MKTVLVIDGHCGGNPSLPRLSVDLARYLEQTARLEVTTLRSYRRPLLPRDIYDMACARTTSGNILEDAAPSLDGLPLVRAIAAAIRSGKLNRGRLPVVLAGPLHRMAQITDILIRAGLRDHVGLVLHTPCDDLPLSLWYANFFRLMDVIVTESDSGTRAVERCCTSARPRVARKIVTIPPGVDESRLRPLSASDRRTVRRDVFGLTADEPLVISIVSDRVVAVAVQAMISFRLLLHGEFVFCRRCSNPIPFVLIPSRLEWPAPGECCRCGSGNLVRPAPESNARLYLHVDPALPRAVTSALIDILCNERHRLGLQANVRISGENGDDGLSGRTEFSRRLQASDLYFSCHDGTAYPPGYFEAMYAGLPIVVPDFGAARENGGRFQKLVPTDYPFFTSAGFLKASLNPAYGAWILGRAIKETGVGVARRAPLSGYALDWSETGKKWLGLLKELDAKGCYEPLPARWRWVALAGGLEPSS